MNKNTGFLHHGNYYIQKCFKIQALGSSIIKLLMAVIITPQCSKLVSLLMYVTFSDLEKHTSLIHYGNNYEQKLFIIQATGASSIKIFMAVINSEL